MHPGPPAEFATARLVARPPRVEDARAIFDLYASDPEATRYLSWRAYDRIEPLEEFLRGIAIHWEMRDGHHAWLLCLKDSGAPIGSISVVLQGGKALFGYVLGKRFWHRGFAAEALRFLVDWSLAQPGVFRAWAFCDVENTASVRVMEKAGLVREGVLRRWHVCPTVGPEPRDCVVCAKVR